MLIKQARLNCEIAQRDIGKNRTSTVLRVEGGIDLNTTGDLRDGIRRCLALESLALLIVDMRHATHIDSSGIGVLLEGLRNATQQHVRFVLCCMPPTVWHVFQRTRLDLLFDIRRTFEEELFEVEVGSRDRPAFVNAPWN